MKTLALLFLLSLGLGLVLQWHQARPVAEPVAEGPAAAIPGNATPANTPFARPPEPAGRPAALDRLPASFAGTQVDGVLHADTAGELIIDGDIRRVFDYFLAAIGEEPLGTSVARLRRYIAAQLPAPAADQASHLLNQYLEYKRQLLALEQQHARRADLDALRARFDAVRGLRAQLFDAAAYQAFFALEEATDRFTLQRLAIAQDPALDPAAKGEALDRLRAALPDELNATVATQLQNELRVRTQALQRRGGDPAQLRALRQQLVGNAATARLEQLDAARQDWQHRVRAYRKEKARIVDSRGLGDTDKRAAIEQLAAARFDARERLRLDAAEHLLAAGDD